MMKFGFIGAGNMVNAIVKGMVSAGYDGKNIFVTSKSVTSAKILSEQTGVTACETSSEVIAVSDVVVLGVKPHIVPVVLQAEQEQFQQKQKLVVSIAAGKTLSTLAQYLPEQTPIIRVMPNINAKIGASVTGLCTNTFVSESQKQQVQAVFETIGSVLEIDESQFGIFSVIGGASVAFVYMYMDALARAALKAGMNKKQALEIVGHTVKGSAEMVLKSGEHPYALIDQVCSPGGTTIEGVTTLQRQGFESAVVAAFDAVLEKDNKIGK